MVLTLDGNSEIGAQILRDTGNLTCVRHSFRSTVCIDITNLKLNVPVHVRNGFRDTMVIQVPGLEQKTAGQPELNSRFRNNTLN